MSRQTIGVGTTPGDNTGDAAYVAFGKVNANFSELYTGQWLRNGTAGDPALGWASEITSGLYRIATGRLGLSIGGVHVMEINANGLILPIGAAATPALKLYGTDLGMFFAGYTGGLDVTDGFAIGNATGYLGVSPNGGSAWLNGLDLDVGGNQLSNVRLKNYADVFATNNGLSGDIEIDASVGTVHVVPLIDHMTSLTIVGASASGYRYLLEVHFTADGSGPYALAHPSGVDWGDGTAPTTVAASKRTVVRYMTFDSGTTWYAYVVGTGFAA